MTWRENLLLAAVGCASAAVLIGGIMLLAVVLMEVA